MDDFDPSQYGFASKALKVPLTASTSTKSDPSSVAVGSAYPIVKGTTKQKSTETTTDDSEFRSLKDLVTPMTVAGHTLLDHPLSSGSSGTTSHYQQLSAGFPDPSAPPASSSQQQQQQHQQQQQQHRQQQRSQRQAQSQPQEQQPSLKRDSTLKEKNQRPAAASTSLGDYGAGADRESALVGDISVEMRISDLDFQVLPKRDAQSQLSRADLAGRGYGAVGGARTDRADGGRHFTAHDGVSDGIGGVSQDEDDNSEMSSDMDADAREARKRYLRNKQEQLLSPKTAWFCYLVFVLNVGCFVYEMYKANWVFEPLDMNPMFGPSTNVLLDVGAKQTSLIVSGQYWRLFTPIFLHAGVIHLAMNMFMLLRLGVSIENAFGWWRVMIVYLLSGLFGNVLSAVFMPHVMSVGASGALFGFVGALLADFWLHHKFMKMDKDEKCRYVGSILFQSLFSFAIGLMPYLDNFSHIGGWIMGFFSSLLFFHGGITIIGRELKKGHLCVFGFLGTGFFLFVGGFLLWNYNTANQICPWCHYLSCVDLPIWDCSALEPQACLYNATSKAYYNCRPL